MPKRSLKELFDASLIGFEQDNQNNFSNKLNLLTKFLHTPIKMVRLAFLVIKCKFQNFYQPHTITTFWGESMNIIIPEKVSLKLYAYGYFETGLTKMIIEYLNECDTFIDIGAHYGYFSLLASTIIGDCGEVHSFEPTPSTFEILSSNTRCKKNININNLAVFSKSCDIWIKDYGVENSALNSVVLEKNGKNNIIKKRAITLDEYVIDKNIQPNFIKIDAEGAEYDILKGAVRVIEVYNPLITLEMGGPNSENCLNFLIIRGYIPYECKKGQIFEHTIKEKYNYDNILLIPKIKSNN